MSRKKLNPRNIPMTGRSINIDAIIDEAMRNDMNHAKLLVGNALLNRMSLDEINAEIAAAHRERRERKVRPCALRPDGGHN